MISKELAKKIAGYSVLAKSVLLCSDQAVAQTLYTDVNPDTLINNSFFNLDLNNDGVVDFKLQHFIETIIPAPNAFSSFDVATIQPQEPGNLMGAAIIGGAACLNSGPMPLPFDSPVNGHMNFNDNSLLRYQLHIEAPQGYSNSFTLGCFWDTDDQYIGLKVIKNGDTYYGWARVQLGVTPGTNDILLKDYAIKLTPNGGIHTGVIPGCPMPTNPSESDLTNNSVTLNWGTQSNAIGYKVRIREAGSVIWFNSIVSGNIGFKNFSFLSPNTNYEWQVRTVCTANPLVQSPFSALQSFTTQLRLEGGNENAGVTDLSDGLFIYPNPTHNEINLLLDNGGDFNVTVYNMLGQNVFTEKTTVTDDEAVTLNIANLAGGTYQIVVTGIDGNFIGRFVKE